MPRDGAITFSDLIGKLDVLQVACDKCGRKGRYAVARLIEQRGPDAKVIDWLAEITAECPKLILSIKDRENIMQRLESKKPCVQVDLAEAHH
jgi:hypothetical protein